ncbi:MAG: VWA domain-containing protein [Prevotellaceae bacterium]|jgi:Ca-activated chloride channel family protein|nr:VWA domain-containing protein [Prevotellaceae bacterium]
MYFEYPSILYVLFVLVPVVGYYVWRAIQGATPSLQVSTVAGLKGVNAVALRILQHVPFALRCAAIVLIILAMARPRSSSEFERVATEGIDIMFALDISTSMLARDFKPDRLGAAKDIAIQFIAERPFDRMGIVVFAGESFTQCPLTLDRATLINLMKDIETGLIEDGTAIGNGLATAVGRLKDSDAKSRVVILLTDGVNNRGEIAPLMAAEIAKTYGVRVYTIGVGANGTAPYPVTTERGVVLQQRLVEIDENLLRQIAEMTDGSYFRATDNTKLLEIYNEINQMEKARVSVDSFPIYKEEFMPFALAALAALLLELLLRLLVLRRLP